MTKFYDLDYERTNDGSVHLIQYDYVGERSVIAAHPEQLRHIAQEVCNTRISVRPDHAAELERRLSVLADRLEELIAAPWLRNSIIERGGDGIEIICRFDALLDLAIEFDGGRLLPYIKAEVQKPPTTDESGASNGLPPPCQFELA